MAINYTSLLGLAQPVVGTESNTWGSVVNNSVTQLVEDAIASGTSFSVTAGDVTLTDTPGSSNQARAAVLIVTGSAGVNRNIIAPTRSKTYIVVNNSDSSVIVKAAATSGTLIPTGVRALVAWNGSDFVTVSSSFSPPVVSSFSAGTTGLTPSVSTTGAVTLAGTLAVSNGGTGRTSLASGGLVIGAGTGALNTLVGSSVGQIPQWDGTTWAVGSLPSGGVVNVTASSPLASSGGGTPDISLTGVVPVANGGTGASTLTGIVKASGTSAFTAGTVNLAAEVTGALPVANGGTGLTAIPTNGQIDIGNGSGFTRSTLSAGTGISITNNPGSIVISSTGSGTVTSVAGSGSVNGITLSGTVTTSGTLTLGGSLSNVSLTTQVTGTLPAGNGGTGNASYATGDILFASSGSSLSRRNIGSTGQVLTVSGGLPVWANPTGGVTSVGVSGTNISVSGSPITSSGTISISIPQAVGTTSSVQFGSFGVGTSASGVSGEIRATNNVTAYFSDDRLKTRLGGITGALEKVCSLSGFYYEPNETAQALGYKRVREVGLSAQEVQAVLPEVVVPAPIDEQYMTIRYERVIALLVEAIKELREEVDALKKGA